MIFEAPRRGFADGVDASAIRAVLFDLDGTLYRQTPLRALMAAELALEGIRMCSPSRVSRLARIIDTFRSVREELRGAGEPRDGLLGALQFTCTADRLGIREDEVRDAVEEWMMRRPLKHLRRLVPRELTALLDTLEMRRLRLGVLSDYPAASKLEAMRIRERFSLALSTADPSINAFKPHPKGFLRACDLWGVTPQEVLYVGDRPEIDGVGAAAAGMRFFLVSRRRPNGRRRTSGSLVDLQRALGL